MTNHSPAPGHVTQSSPLIGCRMTTLVECWNKLDGNVGELSSWVATKDSAAPEGGSEISIEKLESQLNTLKTMFAEKQKLVSDLDAYGPAAGAGEEK